MDVKIQCVTPDVTASQHRIAVKPDTPEVIGVGRAFSAGGKCLGAGFQGVSVAIPGCISPIPLESSLAGTRGRQPVRSR